VNKTILKIAIPAIATNISIPLLSLVDMMIVGHMSNVAYIGAIAVGGALYNLIYWNFGFLRMGNSGLTAQAYGAKDPAEMMNIVLRSLLVSLVAGVFIWAIKDLFSGIAFKLMDTTPDIQAYALTYFNICIIGAPAVLGMYGIKGWFIGMQNSIFPMIIAISINVINIICSLLLVFVFKMDIVGVALGTVISQYCGIIIAIALWFLRYRELKQYASIKKCLEVAKLKRYFSINAGIFIRTLCLSAVTSFVTFAGAKQGEVLLAVNTLMMQLFNFFSYFTDGFAYAGEALTGKYIGAEDEQMMHKSIRNIFYWGISLALIFTVLYAGYANQIMGIITDKQEALNAAKDFNVWILIIPITGFSAFLWDGIMVGATMIKGMVYAMLVAAGVFFGLYFAFIDTLGNHALWLAFVSYLSARGLTQTFFFRYRSKRKLVIR